MIYRLTEVEEQRFRGMTNEVGLQDCLYFAGEDVEAIMVCEGMNYGSFIGEADIIGKKLNEGISRYDLNGYILEKVDKIAYLGEIANRFTDFKTWTNIRKTIRGEKTD
jgi:hypothetical protein